MNIDETYYRMYLHIEKRDAVSDTFMCDYTDIVSARKDRFFVEKQHDERTTIRVIINVDSANFVLVGVDWTNTKAVWLGSTSSLFRAMKKAKSNYRYELYDAYIILVNAGKYYRSACQNGTAYIDNGTTMDIHTDLLHLLK